MENATMAATASGGISFLMCCPGGTSHFSRGINAPEGVWMEHQHGARQGDGNDMTSTHMI